MHCNMTEDIVMLCKKISSSNFDTCCSTVSWNEASRECGEKGMKLQHSSHETEEFHGFFQHALEQANHTGNYSTQVLFTRLSNFMTVSYTI